MTKWVTEVDLPKLLRSVGANRSKLPFPTRTVFASGTKNRWIFWKHAHMKKLKKSCLQ